MAFTKRKKNLGHQRLDVLLLFDLNFQPPADQDYSAFLKDDDWICERHVSKALKDLGHQVRFFGVYDDIRPLLNEIQTSPPDLIFNLCETVCDSRNLEPNLVGLLELLDIKFTGAGSKALQLCKDKGLTKKILRYHGVRVPDFVTSELSHPLKKLDGFRFPAIVKPIDLEGSEGITQTSFVADEKAALDRIQFLHEKYQTDVIAEEYIDGREIYVGMVGNEAPTILPAREMFFGEAGEGEPKLATYHAKWDQKYRKRHGIRSGFARGIDSMTEKQMHEVCRKAYHHFRMAGYGRMDLRLTPNKEIVFIEANPNPYIAPDEDFALAAKRAGVDYVALIDRLLSLACA